MNGGVIMQPEMERLHNVLRHLSGRWQRRRRQWQCYPWGQSTDGWLRVVTYTKRRRINVHPLTTYPGGLLTAPLPWQHLWPVLALTRVTMTTTSITVSNIAYWVSHVNMTFIDMWNSDVMMLQDMQLMKKSLKHQVWGPCFTQLLSPGVLLWPGVHRV